METERPNSHQVFIALNEGKRVAPETEKNSWYELRDGVLYHVIHNGAKEISVYNDKLEQQYLARVIKHCEPWKILMF